MKTETANEPAGAISPAPPHLSDCLRVVKNSHRTELVSWLLDRLNFAVPPDHLPLAMVAPHVTHQELKLITQHLRRKTHGQRALETWLGRRMDEYFSGPFGSEWPHPVIACQVALDLFRWQFDVTDADVIAGLHAIYAAGSQA